MAEDTASPLILKILSGPHMGAEARLAPGEITLGSGDDCDIVLNDQTVAPRHARITVTADGLKLAPLDGEVMVDGEAIDGEVDLVPFVAVSLGTTNLAVGPADEPWPKIALPASPYAPEKDAEAETDAAEQEQEALKASPQDRAAGAGAGGIADQAQDGTAAGRGAKRRRWLPAAVLVLLVLLIVPLLWWLQTGAYAPKAPLKPEREEGHVTDLLAQLDLDQRLKVAFKGDQVLVSGYVDTVDQLRNLNNLIERSGEPVQVAVWAMGPLVQAVQAALQAQNHDIKVTAIGDGALRLNGIVADRAKFQSHLNTVQADVHGIRTIEDRTIARDEILNDLRAALNQEGLAGRLQMAVQESTVTVSGRLTPAEDAAWSRAKDRFTKRYGDVIAFKTEITVADPAAPEPMRLDVRGVSLRADEYFVTGDGNWYKVGEVLEDGSKVLDINDKAIILEKDGKQRTYEYRNNIRWVVERENAG